MNTIDFTKAGGFLLEQESLEMIQQSYSKDFFTAFSKQLGLQDDQNYRYTHASQNKLGWVLIAGDLIPVKKEEVPTSYIKVSIIKEGLVFGSGIREKIYTHTEAAYVNEIPDIVIQPEETEEQLIEISYYDISKFLPVTHISDLVNILLPLDGSLAMRGNLNMGGNKLNQLDVKEQTKATIRASKLYLGDKNKRGKLYPGKPVGNVLEDKGDTISIDEGRDWPTTLLGGKPKLTQITTNTSRYNHPIVIDKNGKVSKSIGVYHGGIPLGLILVWSTNNIPYGWVLCDGNEGKMINSITIPDLRTYAKGTTRYIIYVRYTNRPPTDLLVEGETQLSYTAQEGSTSTILTAKANDPDGDNLEYTWTKISGEMADWLDVTTAQLTLTGLIAGNYEFKVVAKDPEELKIEKLVSISVTKKTSISINRFSNKPINANELYSINIQGSPNEEIVLISKILENTSGGYILMNFQPILDNQEKEHPMQLNAAGTLDFIVGATATNSGNIIGTLQIKGEDASSSVTFSAIKE